MFLGNRNDGTATLEPEFAAHAALEASVTSVEMPSTTAANAVAYEDNAHERRMRRQRRAARKSNSAARGWSIGLW